MNGGIGGARVALYWVPAQNHPLTRAANAWLGRDPETNAPVPQPDHPGIARVTADGRHYGFHATLRPPMRLRPGVTWREVRDAAAAMAARIAPFALPPLEVADLHGFLALRETAACPPLQALADEAVMALDPFREPPDEAELARRRRGGLTAAQEAMLRRWGYPYAFETWFFHMTLTRRLDPEERALWRARTEAHLADALAAPLHIEDVALFTQAAPDRDFAIAERLPLGRAPPV